MDSHLLHYDDVRVDVRKMSKHCHTALPLVLKSYSSINITHFWDPLYPYIHIFINYENVFVF